MNWIKCKDKMPKPCVNVIAWFPTLGYSVHAYHNEGEWRATLGRFHLDFSEYEITHWKPINPPRA